MTTNIRNKEYCSYIRTKMRKRQKIKSKARNKRQRTKDKKQRDKRQKDKKQKTAVHTKDEKSKIQKISLKSFEKTYWRNAKEKNKRKDTKNNTQ